MTGINRSSRIPAALVERVTSNVAERASSAASERTEIIRPERMLRIELLKLKDADDLRRFQVLHNDIERYAVVDKTLTAVRGDVEVEYTYLVTYYEIGDTLPLAKTQEELRRDDEARINAQEAEVEDFDSAFGTGLPDLPDFEK